MSEILAAENSMSDKKHKTCGDMLQWSVNGGCWGVVRNNTFIAVRPLDDDVTGNPSKDAGRGVVLEQKDAQHE